MNSKTNNALGIFAAIAVMSMLLLGASISGLRPAMAQEASEEYLLGQINAGTSAFGTITSEQLQEPQLGQGQPEVLQAAEEEAVAVVEAAEEAAVTTEAEGETVVTAAVCDPSYPTLCLPPSPPDLNCGADVGFARHFTTLSPDPHKLDRDKDGYGCDLNPEQQPAATTTAAPTGEATANNAATSNATTVQQAQNATLETPLPGAGAQGEEATPAVQPQPTTTQDDSIMAQAAAHVTAAINLLTVQEASADSGKEAKGEEVAVEEEEEEVTGEAEEAAGETFTSAEATTTTTTTAEGEACVCEQLPTAGGTPTILGNAFTDPIQFAPFAAQTLEDFKTFGLILIGNAVIEADSQAGQALTQESQQVAEEEVQEAVEAEEGATEAVEEVEQATNVTTEQLVTVDVTETLLEENDLDAEFEEFLNQLAAELFAGETTAEEAGEAIVEEAEAIAEQVEPTVEEVEEAAQEVNPQDILAQIQDIQERLELLKTTVTQQLN